MSEDLASFKRFLKEREDASRAFVNGDVAPLLELSTHVSPATFFSPGGECIRGAPKINAANEQSSSAFTRGGRTNFKILHVAASGDLAFVAGIQRAVVRMPDKPKPIPMTLRVTEGFRREGGEWKLVHRHADAVTPRER